VLDLTVLADHAWWHPTAEHFWVFAGLAITGFWSWAASRRVKRIEDKADTGNAKDIGTTVHDLAQTTEILSAQIHTNTKELLTISQGVEKLGDKLDEHMEPSNHVIVVIEPEPEAEE
jgi:hypothetical protein